MFETLFICGVLLHAPMAVMGLKCHVTDFNGQTDLAECPSSDMVCYISFGPGEPGMGNITWRNCVKEDDALEEFSLGCTEKTGKYFCFCKEDG